MKWLISLIRVARKYFFCRTICGLHHFWCKWRSWLPHLFCGRHCGCACSHFAFCWKSKLHSNNGYASFVWRGKLKVLLHLRPNFHSFQRISTSCSSLKLIVSTNTVVSSRLLHQEARLTINVAWSGAGLSCFPLLAIALWHGLLAMTWRPCQLTMTQIFADLCHWCFAGSLSADCHDICAVCNEPFFRRVWHEPNRSSSD